MFGYSTSFSGQNSHLSELLSTPKLKPEMSVGQNLRSGNSRLRTRSCCSTVFYRLLTGHATDVVKRKEATYWKGFSFRVFGPLSATTIALPVALFKVTETTLVGSGAWAIIGAELHHKASVSIVCDIDIDHGIGERFQSFSIVERNGTGWNRGFLKT